MSNIPPKLETARLTLREHKRDDLDRAFLLWSHPTVVRFIGGKPNHRQQCWMRILNYRGHWQLMGFGYWAVEEKSSGLYIGDVGFADFKRDLTPSFAGAPELGWALIPSHHGQGLATEAVGAAIAWGDQNLARVSVAAGVADDASPSGSPSQSKSQAQSGAPSRSGSQSPSGSQSSSVVQEISDGARTVCMIDPMNAASIRVAAKCGYREYARTTFAEAETILFERRCAFVRNRR